MKNDALKAPQTTTFNGKEINIHELSVAQVRRILEQLEKAEVSNIIDDLLDANVPALAMVESTGIAMEELETHKPSELNNLAKEVQQANPFLTSMIERKFQLYQELKKMMGKNEVIQPEPSITTPVS